MSSLSLDDFKTHFSANLTARLLALDVPALSADDALAAAAMVKALSIVEAVGAEGANYAYQLYLLG